VLASTEEIPPSAINIPDTVTSPEIIPPSDANFVFAVSKEA
jgi:hypothetical protein